MTDQPLLQVDGLRVTFGGRGGLLRREPPLVAVSDVTFDIGAGETLGLVGESGSGKSTTARGILGLVPAAAGTVSLDGLDITSLDRRQRRAARRHMQMIFQDPYSSLDPSSPIGESIAEPLVVHESTGRAEAQKRVAELLERVGLAAHHRQRYPYEFSGGQRQRVAIARAIALNPKLIVCDEAVSALDVSTQNQVINLLEDLRRDFGIAYLFIAHDLSVVRHISDRVAVMYLGRIVEIGPSERIFSDPKHPYTTALLSAAPVPHPRRQRERRRILLPGDLPDPRNPPSGCAFRTRCEHAMDVCADVDPVAVAVAGGGHVACHLYDGSDPATTPVAVTFPSL